MPVRCFLCEIGKCGNTLFRACLAVISGAGLAFHRHGAQPQPTSRGHGLRSGYSGSLWPSTARRIQPRAAVAAPLPDAWGNALTGPPWLHGCLAALVLVIAACSATRLLIRRDRGRRSDPESDVLHVLTGVAMAGMLESRLSAAPTGLWLAVFASAAVWFTWQASRRNLRNHSVRSGGWQWAHPAPHAVECAAMFYMLWPARLGAHDNAVAMTGMSAAGSASNPAVALVFSLFMLGSILWTTDQLTLARRRSTIAADNPVTAYASAGAKAGGPAARADASGTALLAPGVAALSKIAMSGAMAYMLIAMV